MIRTIKYAAGITGLGLFFCVVYKAVDSYLEDQKAKRMKQVFAQVVADPKSLNQEQKQELNEAYKTALKDFENFKPKDITYLTKLANRYDLAELKKMRDEHKVPLQMSCLPNNGALAFTKLIFYVKHAGRVVQVNKAVGPIPWDNLAGQAFVAKLDPSKVSPDLFRRMLKVAFKPQEYFPLVKALKEAGCKLITAKDPTHQKSIAELQLGQLVKESEVYHAFYKKPDLYLVPQGNGFQADLITKAEIHSDGLWAKFPNTFHIDVNRVPKVTIWNAIAKYIKDEQLLVSVDVLKNWWGLNSGNAVLIHIERPQQDLSDIKVFRAIETFIWEMAGKDFQIYSQGMINSGLGKTKAAEKFRKDLVEYYQKGNPPPVFVEPLQRLKAADKVGAKTVATYLEDKGAVFYFPQEIVNDHMNRSVWTKM